MAQLGAMDFRSRSLPQFARRLAGLTALVAAAALVMEFVDSGFDHPAWGPLEILWNMVTYFTVLTNAMVCLCFLGIALSQRPPPAGLVTGVTLWIAMTSIVYHLLLARELQGFSYWTDQALHSIVPGLTLLWWLIFSPTAALKAGHAVAWLLWPLIYVIYALARGLRTDSFPYFFIDPGRVGWDGVAIWSALIAGSFLAAGLILIGLGRLFDR